MLRKFIILWLAVYYNRFLEATVYHQPIRIVHTHAGDYNSWRQRGNGLGNRYLECENSYSKGGNYSAMWRKIDSEWKLQAELFVSLRKL